MSKSTSRKRQRPRIVLPLWALALLGVLILLFLLVSSIWLFRTVQGMAANGEAADPQFSVGELPETGEGAEGLGEAGEARPPVVTAVAPAEGNGPFISADALQPWSGLDRVNILLLGIDLRCEEEGPTHTDSMMVVTIDPVGLSAAALSLPRDLWIEIPGFGMDRINQAHFKGQIYDYPGGGPGLAMETVEATLGIPVAYYVSVNFKGFVEFIDLIGGITLDVPERIDDPNYPDNCYGYDPFFISAGEHELDGETALKYARTRASLGGDVDRAGRQQQVLLAARDKLLRLNMAPRLLARAPELWQSFQDNVETNMSLDEAIQLARLAQDIPRESIKLAVLDYDYVYNETTPDGQQVLVPNRESMRGLRDKFFAPPAIPTPIIENLPQQMREEAARIMIHNGTSVFGLAGDTSDYLSSYGFNVVAVGNADTSTYPTTQIVDFGSHPGTVNYLIEIMDIPPLNVSYSSQPVQGNDILVILGDDWRPPEDSQQGLSP